MDSSVIYDNIFEAIRSLDPNNMALKALNGKTGGMILRQNYEIMELPDGKYGMFLSGLNMRYFRGESGTYEKCVPTIYRIADETERMIAQIKTMDFILYLQEHPDIQEEEVKGRYIDYLALAQHYGFATDMVDLTNEILTAAYFATHIYDPYLNEMAVVSGGIGQLRWSIEFPEPEGKLHMIGLQPLERPGLQSAYGLILSEKEDYAKMSTAVKFRQNVKMNQLFHTIFLQGKEMYFPGERTEFVAAIIKNSDAVTSMAVHKYCSENNKEFANVKKQINRAGVFVVDAPLVCNNMQYYVTAKLPAKPSCFRPIMIIG